MILSKERTRGREREKRGTHEILQVLIEIIRVRQHCENGVKLERERKTGGENL